GEGEKNDKANIAHVEKKRMNEHVHHLKKKIESPPFGNGYDQPLEQVGEHHHHQKKDTKDDEENGQDVAGQLATKRNNTTNHKEDEENLEPLPQKDKTLERTPKPGDPITEQTHTNTGHDNVANAQIARDQAVLEHSHRQTHQKKLDKNSTP